MRKLALVGYSELSRDWANEQPSDVEIWGMNECHHFTQRWDRWFQIHPRNWNQRIISQKVGTFSGHCLNCGWEKLANPGQEKARKLVIALTQQHANQTKHEAEVGMIHFGEGDYGRTPHHIWWLSTCGVPVYMQEPDSRIPTSVRYPFEAITEMFGLPTIEGRKRLYFTSSVAWMLALALYEHKMGQTVKEIRLPGVEMLIGSEYARQRPCLEWWMGMAMGMGIEWVRSPHGQTLLSDSIYAIDYLEPLRIEEELMMPVTVNGTFIGHASVPQKAEVA